MKYAFMTSSCPDAGFDEVLALAIRHGYDGVELRISNGHRHGIEPESTASLRREAAARAADAGVALSCVATSCRFADPATSPEAEAEARQAIALAADLGVPRLRVFGGILGQGMTRQEAICHVAGHLSALAAEAGQAGVRLCVETHDDWCDPADVAALLQAVGHPAVRATWDLMHPVMTAGKSIDEAFETLRPWIEHVHFHDGKWVEGQRVMLPMGEGVIDHRRALSRLMEIGYGGFVSGEWIRWQPAHEHLPREIAALRAYERELLSR